MRGRMIGLAAAGVLGLGAPAAAQEGRGAEGEIALAVLAAPEAQRAGAAVIAWRDGRTVTLRAGTNELLCLADDPAEEGISLACYHRSLEPFMARGRELKAEKRSRGAVDSLRLADIEAKRWAMPSAPAVLYNLTAQTDTLDPATGLPKGANRWWVVYTPYATEATTGASTRPDDSGRPWLMFPGRPWAHLMITPR